MASNLSIPALAERVKGLGGWRRRAVAVVAGAASVIALAPFFVWPVLWLTLPALVWLIDGAIERGTGAGKGRWNTQPAAVAAEIGWWFGFGYFLAGLFWIGEAFLVEAEVFAVLMPFAVLLMPAGLALFYAAATALAALFWRTGIYRVLALAVSLSAMEWLRGHVLSGFPVERIGLCAHPSRFAHAKRGRFRHLRADADRGAGLRASSGPVVRGAGAPAYGAWHCTVATAHRQRGRAYPARSVPCRPQCRE